MDDDRSRTDTAGATSRRSNHLSTEASKRGVCTCYVVHVPVDSWSIVDVTDASDVYQDLLRRLQDTVLGLVCGLMAEESRVVKG